MSTVSIRPELAVAKPAPEAQAAPPDLDTALVQLDIELQKLDELTAKDRAFPDEMAAIEKKHDALVSQELNSVEAILSRSAEASKISAMREPAQVQQKRSKSSITAQTAVVIEIGTRAASLLERLWWDLDRKAFFEAEREFNRLFFGAYGRPEVLSKYRPSVLLGWLKPADVLRTPSVDLKIIRFRQLFASAEKLKAFAAKTFQEISDELDALDRESRERARANAASRPGPGCLGIWLSLWNASGKREPSTGR